MSEDATKQSADPVVDAVFVIGTGSGNGDEELKYALRNIERNCPFIRDVYISGECPEWIDTSVVKHLKWPDRFKHAKDANIIDKLRHACEQPGISKNILFCSDDQFVTRKCSWDDFRPRWLRRYDPNDGWYEQRNRLWHTRLHKTLDRDRRRRKALGLNQKDVFYYQPHIWMQIDRDKFIEYAKWSDYEHRDDTIIASGYFNYVNAGGDSNFDHVFISPGQKWPVSATHVAYSDSSYVDAMKYLRQEFPEPSRFERRLEIKEPDNRSGQPSQPDAEVTQDDIDRIKSAVAEEHAWGLLRGSVSTAERMRVANRDGWQTVWADLIWRWKATTENGKYIIPVTKPPSEAAQKIIDKFKADIGDMAKEHVPEIKKCSSCEARRKRLEEQRAAEAKKADAHEKTAEEAEEAKKAGAEEGPGCRDCAMDHLAVAVAYLNSNACRPSDIDITLARGEAQVAASNLKELGYMEEYDECVKAIDSVYGENSVFTAETFRKILMKTATRSK